MVSSLLAVLDPRARDPFQPDRDPVMPTRDDLMQSFFDMEDIGTSALLAAIAGMSDEELLRRRVQNEIAGRSHSLPRWLSELAQATPAPRPVEVVHVLGDGENIMVGVQLVGGQELTASSTSTTTWAPWSRTRSWSRSRSTSSPRPCCRWPTIPTPRRASWPRPTRGRASPRPSRPAP